MISNPTFLGPDIIDQIYTLYYLEVEKMRREMMEEPYFQEQGWCKKVWDGHLDSLHDTFLDTWLNWMRPFVNLGAEFPFRYISFGSSEAINFLITDSRVCRIHVLYGEYEGYNAIALGRQHTSMGIVSHLNLEDALDDRAYVPGDMFWISVPNSADGEYPEDFDEWLTLMGAKHPSVMIFVDLAYVGAAKYLKRLDFSKHPNVGAVLFSLSKPFGIYPDRVGGVFSRRAIPQLAFVPFHRNPISLHLGMRLMERYGPNQLPLRYAEIQEDIVRVLVKKRTLPEDTQPSNVLLMARSKQGYQRHDDKFRRRNGVYRYCVTPGLWNRIRGAE